ncbi:hypothetical protein Patl1_26327 [Pistacia atlantica]|uniref:Uncharacterized protein n=1 Tax=Pistacia atlantica TaxID=434234 RepID=A0ACC1B104_9ROSI|nr:hypothetical protein Patl1_26327 [Pistacia atlantica]
MTSPQEQFYCKGTLKEGCINSTFHLLNLHINNPVLLLLLLLQTMSQKTICLILVVYLELFCHINVLQTLHLHNLFTK